MIYLATFTVQINQMWVNIPDMDPMGYIVVLDFRKNSWNKRLKRRINLQIGDSPWYLSGT